jgi:hypothetical protein
METRRAAEQGDEADAEPRSEARSASRLCRRHSAEAEGAAIAAEAGRELPEVGGLSGR